MFGRSSLRYPEPAQQVETTEWTILATAEPDRFGNFEYVTWVEDIILANWRDQGFRYHHSEPAEWGGFSSVWQHDDTRTHTCTLRRKVC